VPFQLEADTEWIRRAAATLDEAARDLSLSAHINTVGVGIGSLGNSAEATTAAGLVNLRAGQADEASAALRAISSGLAARLMLTADALDRTDDALRPGHR
jgi:hypothetical protein